VPAFVDYVGHASTGTVDESAGMVAVSPSVHSVTVTLRRPA
jgi:hypothetical protein